MKMAKGRSGVDASPASNKKGNEVLLQNEKGSLLIQKS